MRERRRLSVKTNRKSKIEKRPLFSLSLSLSLLYHTRPFFLPNERMNEQRPCSRKGKKAKNAGWCPRNLNEKLLSLFLTFLLTRARRSSGRRSAGHPELQQLRKGLGKVLEKQRLVLGVGVDVRPELSVPDEGLGCFFCFGNFVFFSS